MYKLMKLEWQKHKLNSVLFQVVYCIIGIYGFMLFISLTSRSDGDPLSSFNDFMALLTILSLLTI